LAEVLPNAEAPEQAAAFGALADLANPDADAILAEWIGRLAEGKVAGAAQLELYEAATRRADTGADSIANALAIWRSGFDETDKLAPYRIALEGGDPARGKEIFFNDPVASCQRCHYVPGDSSEELPAEVGPALDGIGLARSREQLLRSMVDPASEIAPGFEFYDAKGKLLPISAMLPNLADTLGPRPLRDLVAYLDSKREVTRVMIFVHSAGYEHQVAKAGDDGKSLVEKQWENWAAADPRFEVIINRDPNWFNTKNLAAVDSVFFYTTGELPIPEQGRLALQAWVEGGGGFSGAHCATDTFYSWEWYGEMIGGYFDGHPWTANTTVGVTVEDQQHRSCEHFGDKFTITDEIKSTSSKGCFGQPDASPSKREQGRRRSAALVLFLTAASRQSRIRDPVRYHGGCVPRTIPARSRLSDCPEQVARQPARRNPLHAHESAQSSRESVRSLGRNQLGQ
jgi:hypothetical protein